MRRTLILPILLLLGAFSSAPLAAQRPLVERVDSLFAEWDRADSPGAAVAVLKDGRILLERGYGSAQLEHAVPITPATVFHVASVSKQFTAFGVVLLAQQGRLSLDDDVRIHLPELPDLGSPVTVRQLIHHTGGIRDQWELLAMAGWRLDDVITKDHILSMMRRQRELNFPPGSEHLYSNMGYTLLAEIVERVGGRPFPEWMAENVFEPLGMTSTHMHTDHEHIVPGRAYSYRRDRDGGWRNAVLSYANAGATSLFTTVGDLARWLHNLETGAVGGDAAIAQMRERAVLTDGDTIDYAFAIVRGEHRGRTTWSHGGADAGFRSNVLLFPEERLGVVVLGNLAPFDAAGLARGVADVVLGTEPAAAPVATQGATPRRATVAPRLLDAYEGRYEVDGLGILRVLRDRRSLTVDPGDGRIPLTAESDSAFLAERVGARLRFLRAEGRVSGLVVEMGGRSLSGRRLPAPTLTGARLAELAGDYYSPELQTFYRIVVKGDSLLARHPRHGDVPLSATDEDTFAGGAWFFGKVVFSRGEDGRVDGLRVSGGRVRDLRFMKLADGALP